MAAPKRERTKKVTASSTPAHSNGNTIAVATASTARGANIEEQVRRRAYEIYEKSGRPHGRDREHWLQAEAEILAHTSA